MYHEHPLRIMRYSLKNIWLLIFPLLRGVSVFSFDPAGIYAWIKGAWMDIAVIGVILVYGFIRWYFSRITITDKAVTHTEGFIVRIKRTIPFESVSAATSEAPFYLVPMRAIMLRCDTRAGFFKSTDLKIMVTNKVGNELMSHIPNVDKKKEIKDIPKPNLLSVLLFSVFFSSGFSGAVYIAAFFYKGGDIAHELISLSLSRITETTERITENFLLGIPKAAIAVGAFFIAAWLLSFIINICRYARFRISADNEHISIACGLTNRRRYRIKSAHINYTDLRQNLIMKLFGAVTVNISCPGYGINSQLPVLLPIRRKKNLGSGLENIGISTGGAPRYRPKWTSFFSYAGYPFLSVIAVFCLYHFSDRLRVIPILAELSMFLVIMAEIPLAWLTSVKTVALCTSGISIYSRKIIIWCSKNYAFHTVIAERRNIVMVQIQQNIFQKPWKKCHVVIWFSGESKSKYKVKSLRLEDGLKIAETLKHDILRSEE